MAACILFPDSVQGCVQNMTEFTQPQREELAEIARTLVISRQWDELLWDEAWSGKHPGEPTEEEIRGEYDVLVAKAARIIAHGPSDGDYSTAQEAARMMLLETCRTLNIYERA